jgi:hypothetical protein
MKVSLRCKAALCSVALLALIVIVWQAVTWVCDRSRRGFVARVSDRYVAAGILDLDPFIQVLKPISPLAWMPIALYTITHDVDEAILLSDKVLLMSNGPCAQVAEVVVNTLPKRRQRETIHHDPQFYRIRNHVVDFLVRRSRQLQAGLEEPVRGGPRLVSHGLESEMHAPAGTGDSAGGPDAVAPVHARA